MDFLPDTSAVQCIDQPDDMSLNTITSDTSFDSSSIIATTNTHDMFGDDNVNTGKAELFGDHNTIIFSAGFIVINELMDKQNDESSQDVRVGTGAGIGTGAGAGTSTGTPEATSLSKSTNF